MPERDFARAGTSKVLLGRLHVKGFVRAGASKVPLGRLRAWCLNWTLSERARIKQYVVQLPILGLCGDVEFDRACASKVLLGRLRVRCWRTVLYERARAKSPSGTCALRACERKHVFIHEECKHPKLTLLVPARTKLISDCSAQKHSERRWGCRACASGRAQCPSLSPARVVPERGYVRAGSHETHIIAYRPKHAIRWRGRACVCGLQQAAPRWLDVVKHMRRKCRTCRANCRFL